MFKIFLYFLGILLTSLGLFLIILDMNVLTFGYSFFKFVQFISRRCEIYFLLIGISCLLVSLKRKDG